MKRIQKMLNNSRLLTLVQMQKLRAGRTGIQSTKAAASGVKHAVPRLTKDQIVYFR